jgi:ankyrin repeat protein
MATLTFGNNPEAVKALHICIKKQEQPCDKTTLIQLMKNITNINASKDGCGWTFLHSAAFHGKPEIVKELLDRGADPHATTQVCPNNLPCGGNTPLFFAQLGNHSDQEAQQTTCLLLKKAMKFSRFTQERKKDDKHKTQLPD